MKELEYKELNDIVYGYMKTKVLSGQKLLGGRIIEHTTVKPGQSHKLIQLAVLNLKTNERTYPKYNYKKYERLLKRNLRKEHGSSN